MLVESLVPKVAVGQLALDNEFDRKSFDVWSGNKVSRGGGGK